MTHFSKAFVNILNLHLAVVMHSLLVGLCSRTFLDSLCAKPPVNMNVLRVRATKYISIEKNLKAMKRGNV